MEQTKSLDFVVSGENRTKAIKNNDFELKYYYFSEFRMWVDGIPVLFLGFS